MKKILLVSLFFIHLTNIAQNPTERSFQRTGDDVVSCVKHTSDGGNIICGSTKNVSGTYDVFVVKMNSSGNKVWSKTYGGNGNDRGNSISPTFDGGYIITGSSNSYTWGDENMYLIKIDSTGTLTWAETFGNYGSDAGNDVIQLADSSYVITGHSRYMDGIKSIFMLKAAANGTGIFESHFAFEGEGNDIIHLPGDGFIISGTLNINDSVSRSILIRTDEYGNSVWTKTYGSDASFTGKAVYSLADGFMIGGGIKDAVSNTRSSYIIKTNLSGDVLWSKSYNTGEGTSFNKYSENSYLICSALMSDSTSQILATKIDSTGDVISGRRFSNESFLYPASVSSSVNSNIIVGLSGTAGNSDIYSVKTGQDLITNCSDIQVVDQSYLIISQYQYIFPAVTFYSTENNYGLVPYATICSSVSAEFIFTNTTNCSMPQMISNVSIENIAADIDSQTEIDGEEPEFVMKGLTNIISNNISIYPNPGDGTNLNLAFTNTANADVFLVIYDALGRTAYSENMVFNDSLNQPVRLNDKLQAGVYMVTVIAGNEKYNQTLIVK